MVTLIRSQTGTIIELEQHASGGLLEREGDVRYFPAFPAGGEQRARTVPPALAGASIAVRTDELLASGFEHLGDRSWDSAFSAVSPYQQWAELVRAPQTGAPFGWCPGGFDVPSVRAARILALSVCLTGTSGRTVLCSPPLHPSHRSVVPPVLWPFFEAHAVLEDEGRFEAGWSLQFAEPHPDGFPFLRVGRTWWVVRELSVVRVRRTEELVAETPLDIVARELRAYLRAGA